MSPSSLFPQIGHHTTSPDPLLLCCLHLPNLNKPIGAWAFACLTVTIVTKTLTFEAAFAAFTNQVIWLVAASFFFSRGFMKCALYFVKALGKSMLGLAYGLALCELVICPAVPSTTVRAGGVFLPIIKSLAAVADSRPTDASAKKLGAA